MAPMWFRSLILCCSCSVSSHSLQPHGLQHSRLPSHSPSPRACSDSCPLSWWCHPTISSSVVPFSSCLQSFPASGSFPMSWLSTLGGQSIGASSSVLSRCAQSCAGLSFAWMFFVEIHLGDISWCVRISQTNLELSNAFFPYEMLVFSDVQSLCI